jgi:SAM-dependent methyltransferase
MYKTIKRCRICQSPQLIDFLPLGEQELTGMFPLLGAINSLERAPITLARCDSCGLVQLRHSVTPEEMFNEGYGYASALNSSMVDHLKSLHTYIQELDILQDGDTVLDIACNDGTLLNFYDQSKFNLVGIDPSSVKYKNNFKGINLVTDFFTKANYEKVSNKKAKIVTSIACFYDLDDPISFAKDVREVIDPNGVWLLEMAYLPFILDNLAYDGCCHEHLSYYSFHDIAKVSHDAGFRVIDIGFNNINGGSFWVTLTPQNSILIGNPVTVSEVLNKEKEQGILEWETYKQFREKVEYHRSTLLNLLTDIIVTGDKVGGLGASTKFNVILQYCKADTILISQIGDVNAYKFGRMTPGSYIPIVSEDTVLDASKFQYLIVGPYHFKDNLLTKPKIINYRNAGGKLIFPLPKLEII